MAVRKPTAKTKATKIKSTTTATRKTTNAKTPPATKTKATAVAVDGVLAAASATKVADGLTDAVTADTMTALPRVAPKTKTIRSKPGAKPNDVVQRVLNTIEGELKKLERHAGKTSQDRERASRALSQMVSSLQKTVEMKHEMKRAAAKSGNAKAKREAADADEKCKALAQRLEKLAEQQKADARTDTG